MVSITFYYFIELTVFVLFAGIILYQIFIKKKFKIIGTAFLGIGLIFVLIKYLDYPGFGSLQDRFLKYKELNKEKVLKLKYYSNIQRLNQDKPNKIILDKVRIREFLKKANLNKGVYFKDIKSSTGYSEYIVQVVSKDDYYILEVFKDVDGTEVVNFYYEFDETRLKYLIGKYYFD